MENQEENREETRGRPTKKTPELVKKLIEAFKADFTIQEACSYARITTKTFYNWLAEDEEFLHEIEDAQNYLFMVAKKNLAEKVTGKYELVKTDKVDAEGNAIYEQRLINDPDAEFSFKLLIKRQSDRYAETVKNQNRNVNLGVTALTEEDLDSMDRFFTTGETDPKLTVTTTENEVNTPVN